MDKTTSDTLVSLAYQMIALATGGTPGPAPVPITEPVAIPLPPPYPRVEKVNGLNYDLNAPLNPNYAEGIGGVVFGRDGAVLHDPSNAPAGVVCRSPAGYPLFYPLDANGRPVGDPRVVFGGNTFPDDAAVAVYIERTTRTPAQEAALAAEWAATQIHPKTPDPVQLELPLESPSGEALDLNP